MPLRLIIFIFSLCVATGACQQMLAPDLVSDIEKLPTPCWANSIGGEPPYYLKYSLEGDGVLLALETNPWQGGFHPCLLYYRFDARTVAVGDFTEAARRRKWSPIAHATLGPAPSGLVCSTGSGEGVLLNDSCTAPRGKSFIPLWCSPARARCFVLSAEGERLKKRPSMWGPGGSTRRAFGQHYLQLISVEESTFVGQALAIPVQTADEPVKIDWIDESHVVLSTEAHEWFAVITVDDFI